MRRSCLGGRGSAGDPAGCRCDTDCEDDTVLKFLLWLLLLVICWPLALLALIAYPFVWLILLPFRLLGIVVDGVFDLLKAILALPARILSSRPSKSTRRTAGGRREAVNVTPSGRLRTSARRIGSRFGGVSNRVAAPTRGR